MEAIRRHENERGVPGVATRTGRAALLTAAMLLVTAMGAEADSPKLDDSGTSESPENYDPIDAIAAPGEQGPAVLASDLFDGRFDLDWDVQNPAPSHLSFSENPGTLTITTQSGTFTRSRTDYRNLALLDCPAAPGQDFQVTTCLASFAPRELWHQAGLVLWNDEDNFLSLVYEWGEGPPELRQENQRMFTVCAESEGRPVFAWYYADQDLSRLWLRVTKRGTRFELFTSEAGETFTPLNPMRTRGVVDHVVSWGDGVVRRVGLFAGNGSAPDVTPIDASFDLFEIRTLDSEHETQTRSTYQIEDVLGTWLWVQDPWFGDFVLSMDGDACTGTLNDFREGTRGDRIVDVNLSGDQLAFTREGTFGTQRWEGSLTEEDGVLMMRGRWTKEPGRRSGFFIAKKRNGDSLGDSRNKPYGQTGAVNLGSNVNTGFNEGSPDISADGMVLYFDALMRPGGPGGWDIWMSRAETPHQDFSPAVPLPEPINSPFSDSGPCIADDGLTLYFASDRPGGNGSFDLWMATRETTDGPWGEPVNLGTTINSAYSDNHPSISADGLALYFDSRRPGEPGRSGRNDIYVSRRTSVDDPWDKPEALPMNTDEHEYSPDIAADGSTLYYDSYLAGRDLWVMKRDGAHGIWSEGMPLGPGCNTPGIDTDPSISANAPLLYLMSNRPGGYGNFDIWRIDLDTLREPRPPHRMHHLVQHRGETREDHALRTSKIGDRLIVNDLHQGANLRCPVHFRLKPMWEGRMHFSLSASSMSMGSPRCYRGPGPADHACDPFVHAIGPMR